MLAAEQKSFQLVIAATRQLGIGKGGTMPWKLPADMAYFKELTSTTHDPAKMNAVVMGRKTWESIPPKFRPLSHRVNVVLSRSAAPGSNDENDARQGNGAAPPLKAAKAAAGGGARYSSSLESALALLSGPEYRDTVETVFIIGGGQIYSEAMASEQCEAIHLTRVERDYDCDTFMPDLDPEKYRLWSASAPRRDNGVRTAFLCYTRARAATPRMPKAVASRHDELQYLDLVREVMADGLQKGDRTGTGTLSVFGRQMRFDLRESFPLLTTKRVFWRGVVEELLWFISGATNSKLLSEKGVGIWDGNGSREYLDRVGLDHREEGDLGPVYGFQWRHFGAAYTDMHADYSGQGVDQLADVIHKIKHSPDDRRIVLSAWNPAVLADMALPPCHMFCQFYVGDGELSCQMYQRSCDLGLGVPFNIASYALLTRLIAHVCGLRAGDFVHVLGDAHVYANHVEPLREQLENQPRHLPVLHINPAKTDIDDFAADDFTLVGYEPHKKIVMQMAV